MKSVCKHGQSNWRKVKFRKWILHNNNHSQFHHYLPTLHFYVPSAPFCVIVFLWLRFTSNLTHERLLLSEFCSLFARVFISCLQADINYEYWLLLSSSTLYVVARLLHLTPIDSSTVVSCLDVISGRKTNLILKSQDNKQQGSLFSWVAPKSTVLIKQPSCSYLIYDLITCYKMKF